MVLEGQPWSCGCILKASWNHTLLAKSQASVASGAILSAPLLPRSRKAPSPTTCLLPLHEAAGLRMIVANTWGWCRGRKGAPGPAWPHWWHSNSRSATAKLVK